jgi:hypothetical protein
MAIRSAVLRLAYARPEQYYNRQTRTIALEGPRGVLLANYTTPAVRPDPERHRFLVYYDDQYTPYKGTAVPALATEDTLALCVPIEVTRETRPTVSIGANDGTGPSDTLPRSTDFSILTYGETLVDANGAMFRQHSVEMAVDGVGFLLSGGGMTIKGPFTTTAPEQRGITRQSPLYSMLPKTIVTFPYADYQPDVEKLIRYGKFFMMIYQALAAIATLITLVTTFTGKR